MIELKNVTYRYPNGILAIRNVTVSVNSKISVLIGPNGSGKTTLLKIMGCIYRPQSGEVLVNGKDYWQLSKQEQLRIRRRIVYVHEKPTLFRGTVLENLMFPLLIRGYSEKEAKNRAEKILYALEIEDLRNRRRKELSAGEIQLVAFARAIIVNPEYLLLDEPTNSLDLEKRKIVEDYIKRLVQKNTKVIIASHDRLLAVSLAERIIILENGELRGITTPEYLFNEIKSSLSAI